MLHHRTTDLAERAHHIAQAEEKRVFEKTHDFSMATSAYRQAYADALVAFASTTKAENQSGE